MDLITRTVEKRRTCVWYDDVMNYYEGEIKFKNDLPQTRKPDGRRHGFGTSSMQYIVSQYGGTMKISAKDSVYLLEIRLNIPEKAEKTKTH